MPDNLVGGGLYLHLPFCPYLCPYCDFAKWRMNAGAATRYLAALRAEMRSAPPFTATTLYLGGGTPNTYAPHEIATLVEEARAIFALRDDAEATIEMNPDRGLLAGFEQYRAAGLNRVSIGVQSFIASELRVLGRRHVPGDAGAAVRCARDAGFANVSLDLMFGVPHQTPQTWRTSLEAALGLGAQHISTYGLTIEDGTPYARWQAHDPRAFADSDAQAELYAIAIDVLTSAGFEHYEISNFARPGFRCRHNANYWRNGDYLGVGVGATSYLSGERRTTTRDRAAYEAAALKGGPIPAESEHLDGARQVGEAAMLALRTAEGVDFASFAERYNIAFEVMFSSVLSDLSLAGLVRMTPTHVALTQRGRFLANDVCGAFLMTG
ncbi:MAG: radical SAM family heme chaperone HemW [Candidatus Eremiobacteraeota bacterium]|nr:radical SAM family heme chaperone HemW [Candidatus Eremiobacteraeota bacterium]